LPQRSHSGKGQVSTQVSTAFLAGLQELEFLVLYTGG
jgi:hypothetical protein